MVFDARGLKFDDFTVLDSASNKAVANGYLLTKDFTELRVRHAGHDQQLHGREQHPRQQRAVLRPPVVDSKPA
ncbi:MAG: hypothetical protein WKG07_29690 [Hymenobacter sp.]